MQEARTALRPETAARSAPPLWVAVAILFGVVSVIAAAAASSNQLPFSEYLEQARRCVELDDCPSRGGRTGGLPLFHGASWIRLLSYSLRTGHDLTQVQSIVLALWVLSIPTTFFFLRRYLGLRAATLALGLYFPVILVGTNIPFLTYTNLLPLPLAVYYASVALFVEFRRTVFAAIAAVALAAAVSAELGSIVMLPFHLLLVLLTAERRVFAVGVVSLSFAIPFCLDSMDSAREIARQIPTVRFAVGLAISGGIVALVARVRPGAWLAPMSAPDRVRAVMTAALVYATWTIWLACLILKNAPLTPWYFLPASFPFLFLLADRMGTLDARPAIVVAALEGLSLLLLAFARDGLALLQLPVVLIVTVFGIATTMRQVSRRRDRMPRSVWPAVAISACAIVLATGDVVARFKRGGAQALTLPEVERLVPKLYSAGYSYPELLGSLQGPAADDLMALLTARNPTAFTAAPQPLSGEDPSLLVVKVPNAAIPQTQGVIAAVPIDGSRSVIAVRGGRSYLDWTRMRRCRWTIDWNGPSSYRCAEPRRDRPVPQNWPYVEFSDVPSPSETAPDHAYDWSVRYAVPVRTPGLGVPHIVRTANEWPATWRIVRVDGVEFEGALPAEEIRLPDTRAASGVVELEFTAPAPNDLPWVWLPHVIEVAHDNEHLLESFRGVR